MQLALKVALLHLTTSLFDFYLLPPAFTLFPFYFYTSLSVYLFTRFSTFLEFTSHYWSALQFSHLSSARQKKEMLTRIWHIPFISLASTFLSASFDPFHPSSKFLCLGTPKCWDDHFSCRSHIQPFGNFHLSLTLFLNCSVLTLSIKKREDGHG